jgi:hypothetical protein
MNPQAIVAILLAVMVACFFIIGASIGLDHSGMSDSKAKLWAEVTMTVVGGLLVYISSGHKK